MEAELCLALCDDLDQLIRLHDRELDAETLAALRESSFPEGLALLPEGDAATCAAENMRRALTENLTLDELAADFAAIYLNNALGASPYESVWLSDDHLACSAPMFELRDLYAALGEGDPATGWVIRLYLNPLAPWIWLGLPTCSTTTARGPATP